MVTDAVDDSVAFEIYGEFPIIPAGDRRLANGRVLLVGHHLAVEQGGVGQAGLVVHQDLAAVISDRATFAAGEKSPGPLSAEATALLVRAVPEALDSVSPAVIDAAEALRRSIETGEAWYWSRSRGELWHKGATSGQIQTIVEMRVDCDQDAVWIKVEQSGPGACHTGRRSCFYRAVPLRQVGAITLEFQDAAKTFDPGETYSKSE